MERKPPTPTQVEGVDVYAGRRVFEWRGKRWITLVPEDDHDARLWEFCLDDGRIVKTR